MPVTFSFDFEQNSVKDSNDRTRIQLAFLRLGWEHVGGSSWRYPALDAAYPSEDWFNHVIPALMYFRSIVEHSGIVVTRYALDSHSPAAYRSGNPAIGAVIEPSASVKMYEPPLEEGVKAKLSEDRLRKFISDSAKSLQ
jgi:hypothetical protein